MNMLRKALARIGVLERIVFNLEKWFMVEENTAVVFMVGMSAVCFGLWLMVYGWPEDE